MTDSKLPLLHSIKASATRLAVSESTIRRLLKGKEIRATRILGRTLISEAELRRLTEQKTDRDNPPSDPPSDTNPDQSIEAKPLMVRNSHKYL
jgi:excisionase family DNA binding protein